MDPQADEKNGMKRNWVYYWLILAALGIVAIAVPIAYNLKVQLTLDQLIRARQLWANHAPGKYQLLVMIRYDDNPASEELHLWVEDGKVVQIFRNDEPLSFHQAMGLVVGGIVLARERFDFQGQTVEGLFARMEKQLKADEADSAGNRRNYSTAVFDPVNGHPVRYVHRVSGTRQRQEWLIRLIPG